jgi:hypothetical protein
VTSVHNAIAQSIAGTAEVLRGNRSNAKPMPITRRRALAGVGALFAGALHGQASVDVFDGFAGTRVRFADVDAGRALLMADDEWMRATSEFQRRAVMGSATAVTLDAFRRWNGDSVTPWSDELRARWRRALERLAPSFSSLRIPLPAEVLLIASNGQESARAPYTRAHGVVLSGPAVSPGYSDPMLLAHELWHVAARHAPALATRLYAEIGFEPIAELQFPAQWAGVRIANPDAPSNRHAMRLAIEGRSAWVTPVLVATRTVLRPDETFFNVMEPRLLEVVRGADGAPSRAAQRQDGQLLWHPLDGPHEYLRRLGGNTGYVIHHEEAMADNVALLATGQRARNPELLARIKMALEAPR